MSDPSNTPHSVGWTNNSINAGGNPRHPPNVDLNVFVNALMHQVPAQLALSNTVAISQQLLQQVSDIVRANLAPLCALLTTAAGMAILLPSLAVAIVNLVGFTSGGVLAGSLAALIQSTFYGPLTGGVFSAFQAFGATAVIASPAVLVVGGVLLGAGVGFGGWELYKKLEGRDAMAEAPSSSGAMVQINSGGGPHNGDDGKSKF